MAKVIIEIEDVPAAPGQAAYTIKRRIERAPADGSQTNAMLLGAAICRAVCEHAEDIGATVVDRLDPRGVH